MGDLFGTDGIRGVAGLPPLDGDTVYRIGRALASYLGNNGPPPRILIGRDTRESGPWIENLLCSAIRDSGGLPVSLGVISTPAVSFLTMRIGADAGIMISASHNPYQDNGIKIFSSTGMKFSDAVEEELERNVLSSALRIPHGLPAAADCRATQDTEGNPGGGAAAGGTAPSPASWLNAATGVYRELYLAYLSRSARPGFRLDGMRIAVDCAHGALSAIAPDFLLGLGADVRAIHCAPDGRNINLDAGALHVARLRAQVLELGADLGIAFDGDADRAIFVDGKGIVRDGDDVLYLLARHSDLGDTPRVVVGTVMANLGLEVALEAIGFRLVRTPVGDRRVLEEMLRLGAALGGEQSGHVILLRLARTGDGLLTALKVLEILKEQRCEFGDVCADLKRYPQVVRNVPVREKIPITEVPGLKDAVDAWKARLGARSRILLRYSGTEPLVRIMVEGEEEDLVGDAADSLASFWNQASGI